MVMEHMLPVHSDIRMLVWVTDGSVIAWMFIVDCAVGIGGTIETVGVAVTRAVARVNVAMLIRVLIISLVFVFIFHMGN